jgi:hypothetical protein
MIFEGFRFKKRCVRKEVNIGGLWEGGPLKLGLLGRVSQGGFVWRCFLKGMSFPNIGNIPWQY